MAMLFDIFPQLDPISVARNRDNHPGITDPGTLAYNYIFNMLTLGIVRPILITIINVTTTITTTITITAAITTVINITKDLENNTNEGHVGGQWA